MARKVKSLASEGVAEKVSPVKGHVRPVSVCAYPDEIQRWKLAAAADSRPLASWLRLRLLEADDDEALRAFDPVPISKSEESA